MSHGTLTWAGILLLGIWHGVNPAMGWLFAVALGMQERNGRAVWRALPSLALGHGIAIAAAILLAAVLGRVVPLGAVKWGVAVMLIVFGIVKLFSARHPRYGGMRVNARELTTWSALMASAHGAGLMVIPLLLRQVGRQPAPMMPAHQHATTLAGLQPGGAIDVTLLATLVHTAGYLLVTGVLAVAVYERLGLARLSRLWVNVDVMWAVALLATGLLTPFL